MCVFMVVLCTCLGRGAALMFDEALDVIDFCPSNNIAVVYIKEAELVADCAYRRRLARLRKVTVSSRLACLNFALPKTRCIHLENPRWSVDFGP